MTHTYMRTGARALSCLLLVPHAAIAAHSAALNVAPGSLIQVTRDVGDEHCWRSSRLAFNADSTRLCLVRPSGRDPQEIGAHAAIYDIAEGTLRSCAALGFNVHWGTVWDRHHSDILYGVAQTQVLALNVATSQVRVVLDLAPHASFPLERVFHPSVNEAGDRILVQGRAREGSWAAVFTAKLDGSDVHEIRYAEPPVQSSGHCMFTRTASYVSIGDFRGVGKHVVANYDGSGIIDAPACGGHGAFSPSGDLVYSDPYDSQKPGYVLMAPLLDPASGARGVLPWDLSHPTLKGPMPISKFQNHISWNHDDPTWFILSAYTQQNKLVQGWPQIQVIYRVYAEGRRPPELLYECPEPLLWSQRFSYAQGLASTSRDGKWVVFSSSKDHPTQKTGVNVYLLRIG